MADPYIKDDDAVLDWLFDWALKSNGHGKSDWLQSGETITEFDVTVETGLGVGDGATVITTAAGDVTPAAPALANSNTGVLVWLYGGTVGSTYDVSCLIRTSNGRVDERTRQIYITAR